MSAKEIKLTEAEIKALREIDPTPRQFQRDGKPRDPMRAPYMTWLVSGYRQARNKQNFLANGAHTKALLWLHSQFISMPKSVIGEYRKLPWAKRGDNPDVRFGLPESLYDYCARAIKRIRKRSPSRYQSLVLGYMASNCRDESIDAVVLAESEDEKAARRKLTIANALKGSRGPFAAFFKEDPVTGRAPLELVYHKRGQVALLRVNTHAAQQALGGNGKTDHCIALGGKAGEDYFYYYQDQGPQYMMLFPATGTMIACQFTGSDIGNHEDHYNRRARLPLILDRHGLSNSSDGGKSVSEEMFLSLLGFIASTPQRYRKPEQASEYMCILTLMGHCGYRPGREARRLVKQIAAAGNTSTLVRMGDDLRFGRYREYTLSAFLPQVAASSAVALDESFAIAQIAFECSSVASRYARRFGLPALLAHDSPRINPRIKDLCNLAIDRALRLGEPYCKYDKGLILAVQTYSRLAQSKHADTVRSVATNICCRDQPWLSKMLAKACWTALRNQAALSDDMKVRIEALAAPADESGPAAPAGLRAAVKPRARKP